jgi:hypothetical protein
MNDKVNVILIVPEIEGEFNLLLPINKKIGSIINLLSKAINEKTNGVFPLENNKLYNSETITPYPTDVLLFNTNIRNGSRLILFSNDY